MEPLQRLLELATTNGAITQVAHKSAKLRISMYVDDATIFLNPIKEEVKELASPRNLWFCFWLGGEHEQKCMLSYQM